MQTIKELVLKDLTAGVVLEMVRKMVKRFILMMIWNRIGQYGLTDYENKYVLLIVFSRR